MSNMAKSFVPERSLGRTGLRVTRLGAGDLADRAIPFETLVATLRRALDAGLNVVDTAPSYENGFSEQIVGAALEGRHEQVFVIDKIDHVSEPVAPQVEASLSRLKMRSAGAFVFHGVSDLEVWRSLVAPGGRMGELDDQIRRGRASFRGVSSHHPDVVRAAILSGRCDIVMFAVGPFVDARYEALLGLARERGVGTICFKTFGAGMLLTDTLGYQRPLPGREPTDELPRTLPHLSVRECVHYTLSRNPDVALLGLSSPREQDEAFAAALELRAPLSETELSAIRERAARAIADKGTCWWNPA
jgi:aryl-alcohol dehydrogenase-like predicted oxidoreductase